MGRRVLKNVDPRLQEELALAQKEADIYNQGKGSQPSLNTGFNIEEDLSTMRKNNIIDPAWEQHVNKEMLEMRKSKSVELEKEAIKTAGFSVKEEPVAEENPTEGNSEEGKEKTQEEKKWEYVFAQLAATGKTPPSMEQINQWKVMHGPLFFLPLEEGQCFLYRYLKKIEYQHLLVDQNFQKMTEEEQQITFMKKCLLFPVLDDFAINALPAGLGQLISKQIEMRSLFLDPLAVTQMTIKL